MKRILLLLVLCLNISMVLGQEYKNWDKYDIEGFYTIAKSKAEAIALILFANPPTGINVILLIVFLYFMAKISNAEKKY